MGKVLLLVGVPGSGKSFYTKQAIAKSNGEYVICSADHKFEELARRKRAELEAAGDPEAANVPEYMFDFSQLRAAHIECQQKFIHSLEQEIPLIIVDNTNITDKERQFYIRAALQSGYEIEVKAFPKDDASVALAAQRNKHGVPLEKVQQRALAQDLDAGTYKVGLDPSDIYGKKYTTTRVVESVRYIKKSQLPTSAESDAPIESKSEESCADANSCTSLSELSRDIAALKEKITKKKAEYPEDKVPEIAEALDDMTGALDVAQHHIEDIEAKITPQTT